MNIHVQKSSSLYRICFGEIEIKKPRDLSDDDTNFVYKYVCL